MCGSPLLEFLCCSIVDASNDNSTSVSSFALPSLSWCNSDNPYILSDFLSRNSTDLTTRSGTSSSNDTFQLHIQCGGAQMTNTNFVNDSLPDAAMASVYNSCEAIQAINAGTAGTLSLNASVKNLTNYIVFVDLDGQLLFVYFNNNTMANNLKINVPNVNNFATTNVQFIFSPSNGTGNDAVNSTDALIAQNLVLFVTNRTQAALMVNGRDGSLSLPCTIFNYDQYQSDLVDLKLITAEFYPSRAWVATLNYTKMLMYWDNSTVPWWAPMVYYYEFNGVPTTQSAAVDFIHICPPKTPLDIQLYVTIFSLSPVTFHTLHNAASNVSIMLMHSDRGITINRLTYTGANGTDGNKTIFTQNIPMVVDWCVSRSVFDPTTNTTEPCQGLRTPSTASLTTIPKIDKVEMASPDTYSDIGDYDKDVWIIMALRSTHAYLLQRSVNS